MQLNIQYTQSNRIWLYAYRMFWRAIPILQVAPSVDSRIRCHRSDTRATSPNRSRWNTPWMHDIGVSQWHVFSTFVADSARQALPQNDFGRLQLRRGFHLSFVLGQRTVKPQSLCVFVGQTWPKNYNNWPNTLSIILLLCSEMGMVWVCVGCVPLQCEKIMQQKRWISMNRTYTAWATFQQNNTTHIISPSTSVLFLVCIWPKQLWP